MVRTRSGAVVPAGSSPVSLKPTTRGMSMLTGCPSIAGRAPTPPPPPPPPPPPGTRAAARQLAGQLEADHARDEHAHRLSQHRGLRLDAADAPAHDAQTV